MSRMHWFRHSAVLPRLQRRGRSNNRCQYRKISQHSRPESNSGQSVDETPHTKDQPHSNIASPFSQHQYLDIWYLLMLTIRAMCFAIACGILYVNSSPLSQDPGASLLLFSPPEPKSKACLLVLVPKRMLLHIPIHLSELIR
jgi:hypothetical protein